MKAEGYGDVVINDRVTLRDVWYVPAFKTTRLLPVHSMAIAGFPLYFHIDGTATCENQDGEDLFRSQFIGGVYVVGGETTAYTAKWEWGSSETCQRQAERIVRITQHDHPARTNGSIQSNTRFNLRPTKSTAIRTDNGDYTLAGGNVYPEGTLVPQFE